LNLDPAKRAAYANYTQEQIWQFLASFDIQSTPGSKWTYSNLGYGLLGEALARRAGTNYEELLRSRVTDRLGMASTAVTLSPGMKSNLAPGHRTPTEMAPAWEAPAMPGAGSLRSSANDLLAFLAALTKNASSPLTPAMTAMLATRRAGPGFQQALGWLIVPIGSQGDVIISASGATWGYASTLAFDPRTGMGVVVLSNGSENDGGLAWHLLHPDLPYETSAAAKARKSRREFEINPTTLAQYVGRYQPPSGGILTVEKVGQYLVMKSPFTPPGGLRLRAESESKFFVTEADLQASFQTNALGGATNLIIRFAGTDTVARRVSGLGR
jgi:CubicO group peptidase (beta-lactamase class C family)